MKFTMQTECAIELMERLSRSAETVTLADLVQGTQIGFKYAEILIQKLRAAGLVRSVRGRNGGYQLGRADVTLWDIVEAMEGPVEPRNRASEGVKHGYEVLAESVSKSLRKVSLRALAGA